MRKTPKTLSLSKETLRAVTDEDLAHVAGGVTIRGACHTLTRPRTTSSPPGLLL
jgi:hypothetical protein